MDLARPILAPTSLGGHERVLVLLDAADSSAGSGARESTRGRERVGQQNPKFDFNLCQMNSTGR